MELSELCGMKQKAQTTEKVNLHPRNKHRSRYNFPQLIEACPELSSYVAVNQYGDESIDFANPAAVKALNKALIMHFYQIQFWDIPEGYLCPPIPGRADYIHYLADLLNSTYNGNAPQGGTVKVLDIGVGANCVYPIIGTNEYGWSFVGSDIDKKALESASKIVELNPSLQEKIELRFQSKPGQIFKGVIGPADYFQLTICNPPFHASKADASAGTDRKLRNLGKNSTSNPILNFGGRNNELWCEGGEFEFVKRMIIESADLADRCLWFTSLISKSENLKGLIKQLDRVKATEVKTIHMAQGNKMSRFLAWRFQSI